MTDDRFREVFPFESARPYQRKAVDVIADHFDRGVKFVLLRAPVGFGKSAVAYAVGSHLGDAWFLAHQKTLQDQYVGSFAGNGMRSVKGRTNYKCGRNQFVTCDLGMCKRTGSEKCGNCPYLTERDLALSSASAVFNYDYFLGLSKSEEEMEFVKASGSSRNERSLLRNVPLLICDECHRLEDVIIGSATVSVNWSDYDRMGVAPPTPLKTDADDVDVVKWLRNIWLPHMTRLAENCQAALSSLDPELSDAKASHDLASCYRTAKNKILQYKSLMDTVAHEDHNIPVITRTDDGVEIKPLYARGMSHSHLFKWGSRILLMSATVCDPENFRGCLSIPKEQFSIIDAPSTFPPENSPYVTMYAGSMSRASKETTLPTLVERVKWILRKHRNERGIIHTVSYDICDRVMEGVGSDRLIIPRGRGRDSAIDHFKTSTRHDLVLLSPALGEGISLDGDLARFAVLCKVPYPYLGDKWISKRKEESDTWYAAKTAQSIVQMTGRAIRSETDTAVTYFLDTDFERFCQWKNSLFPAWWRRLWTVRKPAV